MVSQAGCRASQWASINICVWHALNTGTVMRLFFFFFNASAWFQLAGTFFANTMLVTREGFQKQVSLLTFLGSSDRQSMNTSTFSGKRIELSRSRKRGEWPLLLPTPPRSDVFFIRRMFSTEGREEINLHWVLKIKIESSHQLRQIMPKSSPLQ